MEIANESFRINEDGEMQLCAGIKDCCGKLIYEGDILMDMRPGGCAKIKIIHKNGDFFYDCMMKFSPFRFSKNTGLFTIGEISQFFKIVKSL